MIFDVDGTLVDSNDLHTDCWVEAFAHFGKRIEWDVMRGQIGKGGDLLIPDLHGRITRSVDGYVRFLRLAFLSFFPALLTGLFALGATVTKQPWVGLAMIGVGVTVAVTGRKG